jgi:NDP-sugar pyrophosphorylase family protein
MEGSTAEPLAATPAVVLAGGRGTRIAPVTRDLLPKALLPVAGRPFLEHQLEWLASEGVRRVVLAVGFLGAQLRDHFGDAWGGLEILWSDEGEELLGTGGGLRRALALLPAAPRAFVVNGDTWFPVPLARLLQLHLAKKAAVTLALARQEHRGRYGGVEIDGDGRIVAFGEKRDDAGGWIHGGVCCVERTALEAVPAAGAFSLERDLLEAQVGRLRLFALPVAAPFCDIGLPESYGAFAQVGPSS